MATEDWPAAPFPQYPQHEGFDYPLATPKEDFGTDEGPPITWPKALSEPRSMPMRFWLTRAEALQFRTWYRDTIKKGTQPFNFPEPLLQDTSTVDAKIVGKPHIQNQGGDLYSLDLTVLELNAT